MTRDEAKKVLIIYRPGTADVADPEIAEALALARQDPELSHWLEQHCARHETVRAKFRQIPAPAGLKEQILSERVVDPQKPGRRKVLAFALVATAFVLAGLMAVVFWPLPSKDDTLANFRHRMISAALRGYSMDFESKDLTQIRTYLAGKKAAQHFDLPAGLQKVVLAGCAIESWQGVKVSMICFRTGQPLPPGQSADLWMFVVDEASVKNAPDTSSPQFAKVNQLSTAVWSEGNKLYLLGVAGDEQTLRRYL
jgi:hypothetical protein